MPEQPPTHGPVHEDVRYEKSEAEINGILLFGGGLIVSAVVIHMALAFLFFLFRNDAERRDPGIAPLAAKDRPKLPADLKKIPAPVLQTEEIRDLDQLVDADKAHLRDYGWVDPKAQKVRIPIEEAMKILADPKTAEAHGIRVKRNKKGGER